MALTAAQLNAYAVDQGVITADQAKLSTDQTTEDSDAATITAGLPPGGQAVLSGDGLSVIVFTPAPAAPGFTVATYPLAT